jgi:hypothetical protein
MSQKQKPSLAAALAEVGGSTRRRNVSLRAELPPRTREKAPPAKEAPPLSTEVYQAPSRAGTVPITVHLPDQVRDQLKILAVEQKTTLHRLAAEAYNDLFAKYGKPEIAPHQSIIANK